MSFDDDEDIGDLDWQDDEYKRNAQKIKERMIMLYNRKLEDEKKKAIERAKKRKQQHGASGDGDGKGSASVDEETASSGKPSLKTSVSDFTSEISNNISALQNHTAVKPTPKTTITPKAQSTSGTGSEAASSRFALVIYGLDNIVLDNYNRKMETYLELGWDKESIDDFISKKENMYGKIASFNTTRVTFTASSRRNRFYEVYNREDMLEHDWQFPGVINALKRLSVDFDIYIVSERTEDLEEKTLQIMEEAGFPMHSLKIFFKGMHKVLRHYKKNCLVEITSKHSTGIGVILHPQDARLFKKFNYTPVGFASIKDASEFSGRVEVVCENWNQLTQCLKQD